MKVLSKEQVINLHRTLIDKTGGLEGLRDDSLLESALSSPFHTFDGEELYPGTAAKIAKIAYSLISNHPFIDGNKRIGVYVMLVLLDLNHIAVDFSDEDVIKIGMDMASGIINDKHLLDFIIEHSD